MPIAVRGRTSCQQDDCIAEVVRERLRRLLEARRDEDFLALLSIASNTKSLMASTFATARGSRAFDSNGQHVRLGYGRRLSRQYLGWPDAPPDEQVQGLPDFARAQVPSRKLNRVAARILLSH
jgi:hypothetical protein